MFRFKKMFNNTPLQIEESSHLELNLGSLGVNENLLLWADF